VHCGNAACHLKSAHAVAFESAKLIQHDPPSLPPRFDEDVASLTPSRRAVLPAITIALVGALAVAASAVCLSGLPWTIRKEIADGEENWRHEPILAAGSTLRWQICCARI
jgi:hypothetical protein